MWLKSHRGWGYSEAALAGHIHHRSGVELLTGDPLAGTAPPGVGGVKGRRLAGKRRESALVAKIPLGSEIETLEIGEGCYDEGKERSAEDEGGGRSPKDEREEKNEDRGLDEITEQTFAAQSLMLLR